MTFRAALVFSAMLALCWSSTSAQVYLKGGLNLFDKTTLKSFSITQPAGSQRQIRLVFPDAAGSVNQTLFVSNVNGDTVTLDWATQSVTGSTNGTVLVTTTQTTTVPGTPTAGISLTGLSANQAYRYTTFIRTNRVADGTIATRSDVFRVRVTFGSGTTFGSLAIRGLNSSTSTIANYTSNLVSSVLTSDDIDPTGATVGTAQTIFAEGVFVTGPSGSGSIQVQIIRDATGTSDNNITFLQRSNLVVRELR